MNKRIVFAIFLLFIIVVVFLAYEINKYITITIPWRKANVALKEYEAISVNAKSEYDQSKDCAIIWKALSDIDEAMPAYANLPDHHPYKKTFIEKRKAIRNSLKEYGDCINLNGCMPNKDI